jgi:hypothetical protein
MDTIRNESMIKLALDTIELVICAGGRGDVENPLTGRMTASRAPAKFWPSATTACAPMESTGIQSMKTSRMTDDMFARTQHCSMMG